MIRTKEALEARLMGGSHLRKTVGCGSQHETVWTIAETDETVHGQAVTMCERKGLLKPLADGLFGDAQTYGFQEPVAS